MSGSISVAPNPVFKTEYLTLDATVSNTGNSDLGNLPVTISIIDPENETVIVEWSKNLSTLAIQQEIEIENQWQAYGSVGSAYIAVISAEINGVTKYLAQAPFVIAEKIVSSLEISDTGRVLILLDPPTESNPQSGEQAFEDNAELQRQRHYLETLLQENGWSYTIVTDNDSFARELNSGAYTQYALFSGRVKLDEQLQKQLRETVFSGKGLLQAGDHDQRYNQLDDALGTKITGKHKGVSGLEFIDSELPLIGITDWCPDDKPLKAQLHENAQAVAHYLGLNANTASTLAVARQTYGEGQTVFAGFDLLLHASIEGADLVYSELLLEALRDITPEIKTEYSAAEPVAVQLSLHNQGTAASLQTILTLPAGSELLDSGDLTVAEDGTVIWMVKLVENQSAEYTFWMRLPEDAEVDAFITAEILIELEGSWETYDTLNLQIPLQPIISFNDILLELQDLSPVNDYRPALQAIDKAQQAYQQMNHERALSFLIQAGDGLIRIDTEQANAVRHQLTLLIAAIAREV